MLSDDEVERFVADGFVTITQAFEADLALRCAEEIWADLRTDHGADPDDPSTWTDPVVRLEGYATPAFRAAANTTALHEAFDQLVGPGRWRPRDSLGTIPVRFPSPVAPGDDGWHVEASFAGPDGEPWLNLRSRGRALLMLFLFSEVGPDDAPTRVRRGSHLDVPRSLADAGEDGREWFGLCADVVPASASRPEARVTGSAGDVVLCHPFLVHAAQPHRGTEPRLMAQPPLYPVGAVDLAEPDPTPVARAILAGLDGHSAPARV